MHRNNSTITGFFSPMTNATTELKSSWQFVTHFGGESRKSILVETIIGSKSGHCIRRFTHRSEVLLKSLLPAILVRRAESPSLKAPAG
jgi:hypothetical protein